MKDVHTEHCCARHGCKYGNDVTCTVANGQKNESFMCEQCQFEIFEEGWDLIVAMNEVFDRLRWAHAEDLWRIYLEACSCNADWDTDCECESGGQAAAALERLLGPEVWHTIMMKRIG